MDVTACPSRPKVGEDRRSTPILVRRTGREDTLRFFGVTRLPLPLSHPLAGIRPPFAVALTPGPGALERLRLDPPRRSRGAGHRHACVHRPGDMWHVADPFVRVDVASTARRSASSNGWRSSGSARCGAQCWLAGRRRAAARRLMPGPGLWPALAVSEQAVLDAPSNTTLQLASGAATGMPRSTRRVASADSLCNRVGALRRAAIRPRSQLSVGR